MSKYKFDDRNIKWQKIGDFEHCVVSILNIDKENKVIDALFKFSAQEQIVLHRHVALNKTFVIQGEHRLYTPSGELKEVRAVGTYKTCLPDIEPHREGGGDEDVIVFFSIRGTDGVLYELLDDEQNIIGTITMADTIAMHEAAA